VALSIWTPTDKKVPSLEHRGERDASLIYTSVGQALSQWEHLESGLVRLFQLLCETPSFAACRAYGMIESSYAKGQLLRAAMEAFFACREPFDSEYHAGMKALLAAYENAQRYRNNIAHGMAVGLHLVNGVHSGYFLCPPSYATKKVEKIDPREVYLLGATYWYNVEDINHYTKRFSEMLSETMRLILEVNKKYAVLRDSQFHP
jgi:hypothetical protein